MAPAYYRQSASTASIREVLNGESKVPFDLSVQPLVRACLCTVTEEDRVFLVTIHHILSDAWSAKVFQKDLWQIYETLQNESQFTLEPLPIQYADYSVWQHDYVTSGAIKDHLDYWLKKLGGRLPLLDIPLDHARAFPQSHDGDCETLLLPENLAGALREFAQTSNTTLFVVTLAAYAMLLAQAADAEDIVIGSPLVNRRFETEPLIGPFAGPIALRLGLGGNPSLRDVVSIARQITLEALEHSEVPFETILSNLDLRSADGRNPLFQFYFFCQPAFLVPHRLRDMEVVPMPSQITSTAFELQLAVVEREEGLRVQIEYNSTLFEHSTIEQWLLSYQNLLHAIVTNPDVKLSELPMPTLPNRSRRTAKRRPSDWDRDPYNSAAGSTTDEFTAPRDAVEVALAQIWQDLLKVSSVSVTETFYRLGGHSLLMVKLLRSVNKVFGTSLEMPVLFQAPTIRDLANHIRAVSGIAEWSSLVPINTRGTRPPLFVVHSYMLYGRLPQALGDDQPFYGLKQPPLGRYTTPDWVEQMLQDHIKQIRIVQPEGPYQIAGWCFAGLMAYEVARRLEESGSTVSLLALFDAWSPYSPPVPRQSDSEEPIQNQSSAAQPRDFIAKAQKHSLWESITTHAKRLSQAGKGRRLWHVRMVFRELFWNFVNRSNRNIKSAAYRFFTRHRLALPEVLRDTTVVTYEWIRSYRPKPYRGDITLIRPRDIPLPEDADPTCRWGNMTLGDIRSVYVPGDRRTMFLAPNLQVLASGLRELMDERNPPESPAR